VISVVIISKDEPSLDGTLADVAAQARELDEPAEVIVVDASSGRLDDIRRRHGAEVSWIDFLPPPGSRTSIPQQRNAGVAAARGDIIAFTDAGCTPANQWLRRLVAPLRAAEAAGEVVTAGVTLSTSGRTGLYDRTPAQIAARAYLSECPTINMAFLRSAFDAVGGLDERFAYGSDIDFSWRLVDAGYRIRQVSDAVVRHDWGDWRRQLRRSYRYGRARARLYRKHRARLRHILRTDPIVVIYPAFLLGLPLTAAFPLYPALLLIPAWRNRSHGSARVLVDHLILGLGVLAELAGL
jgi:cellulose synthase/poly-beta-1,6-N-acetylglucosamine synthase-like glycosyltransferase